MPAEIKEYIEREPEGPLHDAHLDGSLIENQARDGARIQPEILQQDTPQQSLDSLAAAITEQANSIRDEWRFDLAAGAHSASELDTYFAGRIDQHNSVIDAVAALYPALRESLPEQLDFSAVKHQVQQENIQTQEAVIGVPGYAI